MNAKEELLDALSSNYLKKQVSNITAITICREVNYTDSVTLLRKEYPTMSDIDKLDVEYDDGYGAQELFGLVLFSDNSWLERSEYDGSENWAYNKTPTTTEVLNYER